jgi:uncharacterized RDD family membrane protein YckC
MKDYELLSPEKVYFSFDLAGIGSRFVALIIDNIIQYLLLFFLLAIGFFIATLSGEDFLTLIIDSSYLLVIVILSVFAIFYGYFIFFEIIWSGQTPGKRFAKIRVVKDNGGTVNVSSVLIRNTIRVIDALPTSHAIGLITILVNKKNQRLGDMAAGTIVIREKAYDIPQTLEIDPREFSWSGTLKLKIHKVTEEEFAMLKSFLLRYPSMDKQAAEVTLNKLRDFFASKLEIPEAEINDPWQFLQQIAALYLHK